jgi:hypothetical protein
MNQGDYLPRFGGKAASNFSCFSKEKLLICLLRLVAKSEQRNGVQNQQKIG